MAKRKQLFLAAALVAGLAALPALAADRDDADGLWDQIIASVVSAFDNDGPPPAASPDQDDDEVYPLISPGG